MQKETLERLKEKYPELEKDLGFLKVEKFVNETIESQETPEIIEEEIPQYVIDIQKIEDIGDFMREIVKEVVEGEKEPIKGYIELKRIETGCKNFLKTISDLAYSDFDNWDKNDLPYGFTGMITNRLYAKYDQDPIYAEKKEELKSREDILKNAIEQDKKGMTINDSDGCLVEVPEYSYKASLVVKKGKVKK